MAGFLSHLLLFVGYYITELRKTKEDQVLGRKVLQCYNLAVNRKRIPEFRDAAETLRKTRFQ
jgi:hypothetical protein